MPNGYYDPTQALRPGPTRADIVAAQRMATLTPSTILREARQTVRAHPVLGKETVVRPAVDVWPGPRPAGMPELMPEVAPTPVTSPLQTTVMGMPDLDMIHNLLIVMVVLQFLQLISGVGGGMIGGALMGAIKK